MNTIKKIICVLAYAAMLCPGMVEARWAFPSRFSSVVLDPGATFEVARPSLITGFNQLSLVRNVSAAMNTWSGGYYNGDIITYDGNNPAPVHALSRIGLGTALNRPMIFQDQEIRLDKDRILKSTLDIVNSCTIIGNGNELDITDGKIRINNDARLYCTNLKIRGLSQSAIEFGNKIAQLRLSGVTIHMSDDVTLTTGGIYVQAPSTIITKQHLLTFDVASSLTVNNCSLWYEPGRAGDDNNIRPRPQDLGYANNITLMNGGIIQTAKGLELGGQQIETVDVALSALSEVSRGKPIVIAESTVMDGGNNTIVFSSKTTDPVIRVLPGKTLTIKDLCLEQFAFDYIVLEGNDSRVLFENNTIISLASKNYDLNTTYTFYGECIVKGNHGTLTFGPHGGFEVAPHSSLLMQNITIKNVHDEQIKCLDNTATVSYGGTVSLLLDDDYYFSQGHIEVMPAGMFEVVQSSSFVYQTSEPSIIYDGATWQMGLGSIFYYNPPVANRDLITMTEDGMFSLYNATLVSTTTGMRFTRGTFELVSEYNFLDNPGAQSFSEALMFGDGIDSENNVLLSFDKGTLNLRSGLCVWANVLPS
ncbi:MAG: hypothetical protein US69_C0024G0006 [candidate division TM6 bacterium GW2011_GWF2_38_10]|nr:MAG: hypothetical protein US69_C0024G0006 [candidate division TM6 bacterium GW2011_GWF2_38_10]